MAARSRSLKVVKPSNELQKHADQSLSQKQIQEQALQTQMMASNVKDTFSILLEAGYLFKYKDIVWQPHEDEESEEKSDSGSDDGLYGASNRK